MGFFSDWFSNDSVAKPQSLASIYADIIAVNKSQVEHWTSLVHLQTIWKTKLVSNSRLHWQVSLAYSLSDNHPEKQGVESSGRKLLAWINLACLVEGTLKLYIAVCGNTDRNLPIVDSNQQLVAPDNVGLAVVRDYTRDTAMLSDEMTRFVGKIVKMHDLVHGYHDADLLGEEDYELAVSDYLRLLNHVDIHLKQKYKESKK